MTDSFKYYILVNSGIEIVGTIPTLDKKDGLHVKYVKFKTGECFEITRLYLDGISGEAEDVSIVMITNEEFEKLKQ